MKESLNIALVQTNLIWENPVQNRSALTQKIHQTKDDTDLIILPEMCTSGFTMNPVAVAEPMDGDTINWLKTLAAATKKAICGSVVILEDGAYFNRFLFMRPSGEISTYDKRHTFTMAGESKAYQAGSTVKPIEYLGWKWLPQICYDLRFPVFSRNTYSYDCVLYVANWPETRTEAWDTLLKARAIENMSYSVGVNRVGTDGNQLTYLGHSAVYDTLGKRISESDADFFNPREKIIYTTLKKAHIKTIRAQLPFLNDGDSFTLH